MSRRAKVWIALWTVYILWGSTYLGIELAAETMPGTFTAGIRFAIAGLLTLAVIAWRRGRAVLMVGRPELVSAAVPLWVLLLRLAARERPDLVASIGLVAGFGGIVLLVQPGKETGPLGYLLLTVAAVVMWALGSFVSPRLPVPRDVLVATGYEMLAGGLVLIPIGLATTTPAELDPAGWSTRSLLGLVYLIIFGSIVGYTAYAWLLANAPITQVSTYAYVNPVIAIALGVIVLDESITVRIMAGALLILAAVAVVVRRESEPVLEAGEIVRTDGHARELAPARRP